MMMKSKQKTQAQTAEARYFGRRLVVLILLAVIILTANLTFGTIVSASEAQVSKLAGRWVRTDGGYVLELKDPAADGKLKAAYFNPRPINVSKAEWHAKDGHLSAFVELRDTNYLGSTYTLAYNPSTDSLVGIYFHAKLKQQFEVEFKRQKKE
jgi:hypothetical protein